MPLYELLSISKVPIQTSLQSTFLHETIKKTATRIFKENSLIKDIKYMGTKALPYRMKAGSEYHTQGAYWLIYFYSGPQSIKRLRKDFESDKNLVRTTITKSGSKLKDFVFTY